MGGCYTKVRHPSELRTPGVYRRRRFLQSEDIFSPLFLTTLMGGHPPTATDSLQRPIKKRPVNYLVSLVKVPSRDQPSSSARGRAHRTSTLKPSPHDAPRPPLPITNPGGGIGSRYDGFLITFSAQCGTFSRSRTAAHPRPQDSRRTP